MSEQKFSVGDRVKITANATKYHYHEVGQKGVVVEVDLKYSAAVDVRVGRLSQWVPVEELEKLPDSPWRKLLNAIRRARA